MINWSRRAFVRTFGLGAATAVPHLVTARGREALNNAALAGLPAGAAQRTAIVQLDSNENPNGPGLTALNAIRSALSLANRYPYEEAGALRTAIARLHGVQPSQVIIGCGSGEILRMAMQAFTSRTRYLVTAAPTFEAPGEYADAFGVPIHAVRVGANLSLNLPTMELEARGAGLVYICNPHNPTATVLSASAMNEFVERVGRALPPTAVLVDEAYHEYVDDPSYKTSIPLAVANRNVIVSRTCSKIHGLAGLRCGYAVAHAETIAKLARFKLDNGVNQLAIAAARATLGDKERVERERAINRETRELDAADVRIDGVRRRPVGNQLHPGRSPARFAPVPRRPAGAPASWWAGRFRRSTTTCVSRSAPWTRCSGPARHSGGCSEHSEFRRLRGAII